MMFTIAAANDEFSAEPGEPSPNRFAASIRDRKRASALRVQQTSPGAELELGLVSEGRSGLGSYAQRMARFRRRRTPPSISSLLVGDEGWSVATGTNNGRPMIVRRRTDLQDASDRHEWPIRIGIAIPLQAPLESGLPTPEEDHTLGYIEAMICSIAGARAVLAIVITTSDMREFVLHACASDWIPGFHEELQASVQTHQVQMVAEHDETWGVYDSFRATRPHG
jgi:hypothetical protein